MSLESSLDDFKFIDSLPGKKIILKGNHDYWWSTSSKIKNFFSTNEINTIEILNNNCFIIGGTAVCGTRGWFYEEGTVGDTQAAHTHDKKIMEREKLRLEASLKASGDPQNERICFLHYPPVFKNYICRDIIDIMKKYGVRDCWYGHIHGQGHKFAVTGDFEGINYHMVSADFVYFKPVRVK
jgi:predicted phosphohydrolase